MCLGSVQIDLTSKNNIGYKIVYKRDNKTSVMGIFLPKKRWLHDKKRFRINISCFQSYPTGFHIYTNFQDALAQIQLLHGDDFYKKVVKVKYKNVVAIGKQGNLPCVIARSIMRLE